MKQFILFVATAFFFNCAHSQSVLTFCTFVDQNGYCVFNNNKFFLAPDSVNAKIVMNIKVPDTFKGISKITYNIFSVNKSGNEAVEDSIDQKVQDSWGYAWVPHSFKEGKHRVKIYNDKGQLICGGEFEIFNN